MRKVQYFSAIATFALIAAMLAMQLTGSAKTISIKVDGSVFISQSAEDAIRALERLGYEPDKPSLESAPGQMVYSKPSAQDVDPENLSFIRLSMQEGRVLEMSGRPEKISIGANSLVVGHADAKEIKRILGPPNWERSVANGAHGMCYENAKLYLEIVDGKLSGFSLGAVPAEMP